jgi:hypothetical protein
MIAFSFHACTQQQKVSSIDPINWEKRVAENLPIETTVTGMTYLSVYSKIYSITEHRSQDLTSTISMRNTNRKDTIYINRADYYGTDGKLIRTYFDYPVFIAPMETAEIIIDEDDRSGGSGANFLFEWTIHRDTHEPLFEAVMISTASSQGISFVREGKRVE